MCMCAYVNYESMVIQHIPRSYVSPVPYICIGAGTCIDASSETHLQSQTPSERRGSTNEAGFLSLLHMYICHISFFRVYVTCVFVYMPSNSYMPKCFRHVIEILYISLICISIYTIQCVYVCICMPVKNIYVSYMHT